MQRSDGGEFKPTPLLLTYLKDLIIKMRALKALQDEFLAGVQGRTVPDTQVKFRWMRGRPPASAHLTPSPSVFTFCSIPYHLDWSWHDIGGRATSILMD